MQGFEGKQIRPGDADYDDARKVWNGMVDRRPALIAQCSSTADVVVAVNHARTQGLAIAVRGGSHNVAGNAVCDDGLVVDLRPMRRVEVDVAARTATAEGGVTWGEYDAATQAHGLASPGGAISSTGIAGLTLGGGFGWLSRSWGLACDNLVAAEVVTADGQVRHASADEHADLFWALRGGGGNFGVVTRFTFRLQELTEMVAGLVLHPRSEAPGVIEAYKRMTESAPDSLSSMAAFLCTPEGDPVVGAFTAFHGPAESAGPVLADWRAHGTPLVDDVGPKPYTAVQQTFDPGFPSGLRNYWKSAYIGSMTPEFMETLIEHANRAPTPLCVVGLEHMMGGAVARVALDETAFGVRDAQYNLLMLGAGDDPSTDGAVRDWVRAMAAAVKPFSTGSLYVNYMDQDEPERVADAYGAHYARLREIKKTYDPSNLFRVNQNIVPAN